MNSMRGAHTVLNAFITLALIHTNALAQALDSPRERVVQLSGEVQNICPSCNTADLVEGGAVAWDVVSLQITSPQRFAGKTISVEVLLEGSDFVEQRKSYLPASHIVFPAAESAVKIGRVMLHVADIASAGQGASSSP